MAVTSADDLVIADAYNHRILGLAPEGATMVDWERSWAEAAGIDSWDVPMGLAIDTPGRIHVADSANKRAVLLGAEGALLGSWQLTDDQHPEMYAPVRGAVHGARAYFLDPSNDRIVVLEVRR